mmetsp:Transcript_78771/g.202900  ORF Transcript_78771/g.202900 Transcript_78771/m.202900 type:complete len:691 (-) Transcript_78771:92-2164(-)
MCRSHALRLLAAAVVAAVAAAKDLSAAARSLRGATPSDPSQDWMHHKSEVGKYGMVCTSHREASNAAVQILQRGGNAVDAALAIHFALAVVEPQHVSISGGGVMLHKPMGQKVVHVDFREEAPALYHPKTFCKNTTCLMDPDCGCDGGAWPSLERCTGGHATGVPGFPALLALAARDKLISMSLPEIAAPAIELARNGWKMYAGLYKSIAEYAPQLARDAAARELFLDASGTKPKAAIGELMRNPQLGDTIELLVKDPAAFYTGPLGEEFVETARRGLNTVTGKHGVLSVEDVRGYRAVYRAPVHYEHTTASGQSYLVAGSAPPFSGGVAHAQIFNLLEHTEPMARGNDTRNLGFFLDAQNAAFADRNQYVSDPDFVDVDVRTLTSKSYAAMRAKDLFGELDHNDGAAAPAALKVPIAPGAVTLHAKRAVSTTPDHGTAHLTVIDAQGGIVAMTSTVNMIMGSRVVVPGRGYLLNNELCDFDSVGVDKDGLMTVNAAEGGKRLRRTALGEDSSSLGGKRPRSSMSPTVVVPKMPAECEGAADSSVCHGAPFSLLGLGAPGGTDIIGGVANVLRNILRAPPADARELQRYTDMPRAIGKNSAEMGSGVVELALFRERERMDSLRSWGYELTHTPYAPPYYVGETYSRVQSAMMLRADASAAWEFVGAADSMRLPACVAQAPQQPEAPALLS